MAQTPSDFVRVFRLIEYVGPRELVKKQIERSLHGTRYGWQHDPDYRDMKAGVRITATTLGILPEMLTDEQRLTEIERMEQHTDGADEAK